MKSILETALQVIVAELARELAPEEQATLIAACLVEYPADPTHGAYSTNAALVLAKPLGQNPRTLAEELVKKLQAANIPHLDRIEIAGPGFVNVYLGRVFFVEKITTALEAGSDWGKNDSWAGKKVLVEYTDPNPFKEFHIGHLFTNTVGESLARMFMMNGADTKRLNYQGDVGMHVANAVWGMQQLGFEPDSDFTARDLGRAYAHGATAYKADDETVVTAIKAINKAIYDRSDETINALYDAGRTVSLEYFETIYATVGTQFDHYFFESEAGPKGKELVLAHSDTFVESDGAKVFQGEDHGLHTRVFVNSEGLPTYEAKELALAKMKEDELGVYDHSVISTANEITEYFKVLRKAMSFVYPELAAKTEHIGHGTVRLAEGKMSSRTGDVIPAVDFITDITTAALEKMAGSPTEGNEVAAKAVAIAAIKYATLKGNILQDSVFDTEKALSFKGDSGPYLLYTYARIQSVLEKAAEAGVVPAASVVPVEAYAVEELLHRFPEVVAVALAERAPHKITSYLTELAGTFNTFYETQKIADPSDEYAPYKALVSQSVALTLKNGLWTLGIDVIDQM